MVTLFLLILAGFVLLIAGADFIVKSSVAMANKLKIPPLIVGLTVVAFGTSAPEFVVSLTSALEGAEGLVLGNVVGSNTANILLILGSSALIFPIYVNRRAFFRDYGFLLLVTLVYLTREVRNRWAIQLVGLALFCWFCSAWRLEMLAMLSLIPLCLYNGERGFSNKALQYGFYAFYPVHILILSVLARYVF